MIIDTPHYINFRKDTFCMSKPKKIDLNNLTPNEKLKYEVAKELGLFDKVLWQKERKRINKDNENQNLKSKFVIKIRRKRLLQAFFASY